MTLPTVVLINQPARLNDLTCLQIFYVEIQPDKIVIHGHADSDISDLDFSAVTLHVKSADGLHVDLEFVQTGSRQLGMGRRVDLIFHVSAKEKRGLHIADGFGFEVALSDYVGSGTV